MASAHQLKVAADQNSLSAWATGLLAEGRRRLDLIQSSYFDLPGMFPELACYDCHACHRSMKTVQWRSLPRHGGADPGMPFINDGTFVMALALIRAIEPSEADGLLDALKRMHTAGSSSVSAIRDAAGGLESELDMLADSLNNDERYRPSEFRLLLSRLQDDK